ncbi:MAG: hypothetical protein JKY48_13595 [Flavobacteriales bacterium]|nr:hypothetical protein [Flavobacteriales bacterium]
MMKYSILFIFSIASQFLFSQARESSSRETAINQIAIDNKTSLLLKLGAGIPNSDFGDSDLNNEKSGLALPGVLFEVALDHSITESVYLSFMGRFQYNGLNEEEFIDFYRGLVPSNVTIAFESDAWRVNSFMGGLGTKTFLDDRTDFISRFMIGFSSARSPSFNAKLSDGRTSITENQESATASAFSYLIGVGINIQTNKGLSVLISADYSATTPEFSNVRFIGTNNNITVANETFSFEQEIRLINLSIGLAIPL